MTKQNKRLLSQEDLERETSLFEEYTMLQKLTRFIFRTIKLNYEKSFNLASNRIERMKNKPRNKKK